MEKVKNFIDNLGDEITCVYGEAGTGKTTFCVMMAIDYAKKGKRVYYMDTEGGCEIKRVKQIANDDKVLEKIFFVKCNSFDDQCDKVKNLENIGKKFDLVIIDTVGNHYRKEVREDVKENNKKLIEQLTILSGLSKENLPILIANQVSANIESYGVKLIGGLIVERRSKKLIKLENKPRKMKIVKPEKREVKFDIKAEGIILS